MQFVKEKYKKISKKIILFALTMFTMLSVVQLPINASSNQPIILGKISDTGAELIKYNSAGYPSTIHWNAISKISVNGKIAFCIEPMVLDLVGTYSPSDLDVDTRRTLSRIVYYGWDTTAKTDRDYATTQYMIWESLGVTINQWYGSFGNDYPSLKANVQSKIDRHTIKPSFDNGYYEINLGDTLSLYDDNNVISQFHIKNNGGANVWIENNQLHIIPNENTPDEITITLQKALDEHVGASIAYRSNSGQDVATFKLKDPLPMNIKVKVNKYGNIQATKVDKDTIVAHGDATLQGAIYGLYANEDIVNKSTGEIIHAKDSLIDTRTVDENGNMAPFEKLRIGSYYLKEIQAPQGYELSDDKVIVNIVPNDTVTATVEDTIKRGQFSLTKVKNNSNSSEIMEYEEGAEFITVLKKYVDQYGSIEKAYENRDTFSDDEWSLLVTDKNGYARTKELAYGTYVTKQTKSADEMLILPNEFETVIDGVQENEHHYVIKNEEFKPYLKIVKRDIETQEIVKFRQGAIFKIRDLKTGEFVKQQVATLMIEEFHAINGEVILPLPLSNGNYELLEVKAPQDYLIEETPIPFTITQSNVHETDEYGNPIYVVEISNQRVKGQIEIYKFGYGLTSFENGQFIYETQALEGAEFTLYAREDILDSASGKVIYKKDSEISKGITNENGIVTFDNLLLGKYYAKETKVPHGYILDEKEYELNVQYVDERTPIVKEEIEVYNPKQNYELDIVKVDKENNQALEGAVFELQANRDIYNVYGDVIVPQGTVLEVATSNENGKVNFTLDLPTDLTDPYAPMPIVEDKELDNAFGVWYDYVDGVELYGNPNSLFVIKEVQSPIGYELKKANYYFDTMYQQNISTISIGYEVANEKIKADIKLIKIDSNTKEPIINKDFIFGLYSDEECFDLIEEKHADITTGTIDFKDLEYGVYYLKEIQAPQGYDISMEVKKIEVKENGVYVDDVLLENEDNVYIFTFENYESDVPPTYDITNKNGMYMLFVICGSVIIYTLIKKKEDKKC